MKALCWHLDTRLSEFQTLGHILATRKTCIGYRIGRVWSCMVMHRLDALVFSDRTRAYSITGLLYYSLEIEIIFPFNPFTWVENE